MANHNDKRRQLDDEMSRFEAEISGPPGIGGVPPLQPPPPPPRTVIGSNTFTQIQQQLQQQHIEPPGTTGSPHNAGMPGLPAPPGPPGHPGPPGPRPPGTTNGSSGVPPLPPPPPPPGGFIGPDVGPRQPPPGPCSVPPQQQQQQQHQQSQQQQQQQPQPQRPPPPPPPGFIPPQLSRQQLPPNMMEDRSHQMGPMMGGGPSGFMRPPGPPRHMGPPGPPRHPGMPGPPRHPGQPRHPGPPGPPGFGGPQHGPPRPGPHGPPGPDQGHHGPPNHNAPGMGPQGPPMHGPPTGPGPSTQNFGPSGHNQMPSNPTGSLLGGPGGLLPPGVGPLRGHPPPPPPPPGVLQAQQQQQHGPNLPGTPFVPPIISKPPAIISSAPKLYTSQPVKHEAKPADLPPPVIGVSVPPPAMVPPDSGPEPKKKKMKPDIPNTPAQAAAFLTHAQEMAEKVRASTVTIVARPEGLNPPQVEEKKKEGKSRNKKNLRCAGGQIWEDTSLGEWDHDDFRIFCGDLGNDVTDELLTRYFSHFASFAKAKVVRDKRTNKSKGYGFISFSDPQDYIRAMKEMNGKYVGSRPIKLRKSTWKDRNVDMVQKKQREKQLLGLK